MHNTRRTRRSGQSRCKNTQSSAFYGLATARLLEKFITADLLSFAWKIALISAFRAAPEFERFSWLNRKVRDISLREFSQSTYRFLYFTTHIFSPVAFVGSLSNKWFLLAFMGALFRSFWNYQIILLVSPRQYKIGQFCPETGRLFYASTKVMKLKSINLSWKICIYVDTDFLILIEK